MNPLDDILGTDHGTPCLSLYQPTHRSFPDNRQDPIRFRNLVKTLDERLREADPAADANALLAPFHALAEDRDFWNHAQDALAVLGAPGSFRVMRLQRPVGELAVVADSFHVKPLLRIVQSADRYQVLGLSRDDVSLFAGNRDALDEVELDAAVSDVVANALGAPRERPKSSVWTYRAGASGLQSGAAVRHGIGSEKGDLIARETEKLFREVDRAIVQVYSRRSGLPLVLAGLPEHQALFRRVSRNPFLLPDGIDVKRQLTFDVKPPAGDIKRTTVSALKAGGGSLTLSSDLVHDLIPARTRVNLSVGPTASMDIPGLLTALDRYPYGCAEQTVSRALPLLYANTVAAAIGIAPDKEIKERVQKAVDRVFEMQDGSGAFGVWDMLVALLLALHTDAEPKGAGEC